MSKKARERERIEREWGGGTEKQTEEMWKGNEIEIEKQTDGIWEWEWKWEKEYVIGKKEEDGDRDDSKSRGSKIYKEKKRRHSGLKWKNLLKTLLH